MNLLQSPAGRRTLFTVLYLSEGAPIGFIWWALPTLLRARGIPVEEITGLTAVLVLPWAFKFLWAPLIDSLRSSRWGFRAWIMSAQLLMGLTLIPIIYLEPVGDFALLKTLLILHAFCAATQDVAIDALAISVSKAHERGLINGCMQAGMLVGRSIFGGGALMGAQLLGWNWIFIGLIGCIWSSLALLLFVQEPASQKGTISQFRSHLRSASKNSMTWIGLVFALTSAAAFEAAGALAGPFLIDRKVSEEAIGFFFALPVVIVTILGGLIGGRLSDRLGRANSVGLFLVGFVAMVLALGSTDSLYSEAASPFGLLAILLGMYLFIGLFTASSYALFMDLTDPRLGATQFSTFMAATNGCEAWSAWAGGQITAKASYAMGFFLMSAVSLLSLPLLKLLARRAGNNELSARPD